MCKVKEWHEKENDNIIIPEFLLKMSEEELDAYIAKLEEKVKKELVLD